MEDKMTQDKNAFFGQISAKSAYKTMLQACENAKMLASGWVPGLPPDGSLWHSNDDGHAPAPVTCICQVPEKTGIYHVVGQYDEAYILAQGQDEAERRAMRSYGRHLTDADVIAWPVLWVESDHGTMDEQQAAIDAVGLPPQIEVSSGDVRPESIAAAGINACQAIRGKSLQAYYVLSAPLQDWPTVEVLMSMWVTAVGGDPAIITRARKMRALGMLARGKNGDARIQTVLHGDYDNDVTVRQTYTPEQIYRALSKHADQHGHLNLPECMHGLRQAEVFFALAKKMKDETMAAEVLAYATWARDHRRAHDMGDPRHPLAKIIANIPEGIRPAMHARGTSHGRAQWIDDSTIIQPHGMANMMLAEVAQHLTPGGKIMPLDECPIPGHTHTTPSVGVGMTEQGALFISCFSSVGGIWYAKNDKMADDGISWICGVTPVKEGGDTTNEKNANIQTQSCGVTPSVKEGGDTTNEKNANIQTQSCGVTPPRWVHPSIPTDGGVYLLVAPTCTGKTTMTADAVGDRCRSLLVVSPTIALSRAAAIKYGCVCYDDLTGQITATRISICAPSLLRLDPSQRYSALVIEEINQVADIMHARRIMRVGKKNTSAATWHTMQTIARNTLARGGRVIAGDAHCSPRTVRELTRITGGAPCHIIGADAKNVWSGQQERMHPDLGTIIAHIIDTVGQGIGCTIATDSQAMVEAINAILGAVKLPSGAMARVLAIHAESPAPAGDVSQVWDQYDCVVYDQAAQSGVSYTGSRHTSSYLIASVWGREVTTPMILQLRHRNRVATNRHSWVSARKNTVGETSLEKITASYEAMALRTGKAWAGPEKDGATPIVAADDDHFRSYLDTIWASRVGAVDVHDKYYDALRMNGMTVVEVQPNPQSASYAKMVRDIKKSIKSGKVDTTMAARCISSVEAKRIAMSKTPTQLERAEVAKYTTMERWGVCDEDGAKDTVTKGKKWAAANRYVEVALLHRGEKILADLSDRVGADHNGQIYRGQMQHKLQAAAAIKCILSAANIDPDYLFAPCPKPEMVIPYGTSTVIDIQMGGGDTTNEKKANIQTQSCGVTPPPPRWSADSMAQGRVAEKIVALAQQLNLGELLGARFAPSPTPLQQPDANDPFASHLIGGSTVAYIGRVLALIGIKASRVGKDRTNYTVKHHVVDEWGARCQRLWAKKWGMPVDPVEADPALDIMSDDDMMSIFATLAA